MPSQAKPSHAKPSQAKQSKTKRSHANLETWISHLGKNKKIKKMIKISSLFSRYLETLFL